MTINETSDAAARTARFTRLYEEHHGDVVRFACRRVGAEVARDVAHATFLVVWRRLDAVPAHTRPWILTVAHHTIGNRLRAERRLLEAYLRAGSQPAGPGETPEDHAFGIDLTHAWDCLETADREVLALVAWDGLTPSEAAGLLGCAPGTYRVRLLRARARLRDLLGHDGHDSHDTAIHPLTVGAH